MPRPGVVQGAGNRLGSELDGHVDERVVGGGEVGEPEVILERQCQMPSRDLRAVVQPTEEGVVLLGQAHFGEEFGELRLRVSVRRQDAMDRCHCRHRTNGTCRATTIDAWSIGYRPPAGRPERP